MTHMLLERVYWVDVVGMKVAVGLVGQLFHIYAWHAADACSEMQSQCSGARAV